MRKTKERSRERTEEIKIVVFVCFERNYGSHGKSM